MKTQFNSYKWGENTEVIFEPFTLIPNDVPVTSCMVIAVKDKKKIVLSKPPRGWGLPGGHVETGETPETTVIRELIEGAAVELDRSSLQVVGGWLAKKIHKTEKNRIYPDLAYQLLFIAKVTNVNQFSKQFEVEDRMLVPINEVLNYITSPNFKPVFNFITTEYAKKFINILKPHASTDQASLDLQQK